MSGGNLLHEPVVHNLPIEIEQKCSLPLQATSLTKVAVFLETRRIDRVSLLRKCVDILKREGFALEAKSDIFEAGDEAFLPRSAGICLLIGTQETAETLLERITALWTHLSLPEEAPRCCSLAWDNGESVTFTAESARLFYRIPFAEATPAWFNRTPDGDEPGHPWRVIAL